MDMDTRDIIYRLAKGLYSKLNKRSYGVLRKRLDKNGFSEIALYSAVARHLDENDIKPESFIDDLEILLRGCGDNPFFPKVDNGFSFLAGQYYDLRHGDLSTGGAKSAEQRGRFLCNNCFLIKEAKEHSKRKNYANSCNACYLQMARDYAKSKSRKNQQARQQESAAPEAVAEPEIVAEPEVVTETPKVKAVRPIRPQETAMAELVLDNPEKLAKIEEIAGDQHATIVQLSCKTENLHKLLGALSPLMEA